MLLFSCSNKEQKQIIKFKLSENLITSELSYEEKIIPTNIVVTKNRIVLFSTRSNDYFCFIYNKQDLKLLAKTARKGKGPNEISQMGTFSISPDDNRLYIQDIIKNSIYVVDIDSAVTQSAYHPKEYFKIPMSELNPIFQILCLNDSLFAIAGYNSGKYLLTIINSKGKTVKNIGLSPVEIKEKERYNPYIIYNHKITYNPFSKSYAIVFKSYDRIIGIDTLGNRLFESIGPDNIEPKSITNWVNPENQINAYFKVKANMNNIYCLYSGQPNAMVVGNGYTGLYCHKLNVFDWRGKPIIQLNIDKQLYDFDIDSNENLLYGLTPDTESQLVVCKIPL